MSANFGLNTFSLEGKVALITGGNGGLGSAMSLALARAGATVFIASLMESDVVIKEIREDGGTAFLEVADITQDGIPNRVVENCIENCGGLDVLVNCAGVNPLAEFDDFGRDEWDFAIKVNLTAAFEMSHFAGRAMKARGGGKIINICSLFSFLGGRQSPAYAASKHGIAGLTRALCDELAESNIQVNGVAPGYFATELTHATRSNPQTNADVLRHIPAGRWGDPQELMGAVVFLASAASNYINGHILSVDGGYLVR